MKITNAVNLLLHKIKLSFFTNLISQKLSDSAVILAIAQCPSIALKTLSNRFCLPAIRPFQNNIFKEYFFTALIDFGYNF